MQDDIAVDIQNEFYTAKGETAPFRTRDDEHFHFMVYAGLLHTDDAAALNGFHAVITKVDGSDKADELAEWRFKALKNIVKTRIRRGETNEMLESYQTLLEAINSGAVGRNRAEKAVNKILDLVSSSSNTTLIPFYSKTLDALQHIPQPGLLHLLRHHFVIGLPQQKIIRLIFCKYIEQQSRR